MLGLSGSSRGRPVRTRSPSPGLTPKSLRWAAAWCSFGLSVLAAGCSETDGRVAVYPVTGKVTVAGEVPEGALVVLYPAVAEGEQALRPSAKVGKDGSFSFTTYEANDGAPSGDYTATIQWNKLVKKGQDYVAGPNVIGDEYASHTSSPWKIKVATGPNELAAREINK
jgi:hypothetical protein